MLMQLLLPDAIKRIKYDQIHSIAVYAIDDPVSIHMGIMPLEREKNLCCVRLPDKLTENHGDVRSCA